MDKLTELKTRLAEVDDLENAAALLEWDQQVMMPPAGAEGRSHQYATLQKLAHEKFVDEHVGELLEDLQAEYRAAPAEDDEAALVRVAWRQFQRKVRVPTPLVQAMAQAVSYGQQVWVKARADNDYELFRPQLEHIFDLKRQMAACFPENEAPYDALLDEYEPGMKTSHVAAMFAELKREQVPLAKAIAAKPPADDSLLRKHYEPDKQLALSVEALKLFGYDFSAGRQDLTVHPFCTSFGYRDVRVTTRVDPNFLPTCLMGTMHECGHGLYEQGLPGRFVRTPLARSASLGIHESQSRTWENLVGRSRGFWEVFFPKAQAAFPEHLTGVDAATFHRAINAVRPSFIRVEADEVHYNLHTLLRFEMEVELLDGRLDTRHAPEAWNAKFKDYLGLDVPDNRQGILQDVHWSSGLIGYFPTYTIGNLASVQFFEQAAADVPTLRDDLAAGRFDTLLAWLRENIHAHANKYLPADLIQRVTGKPLSAGPYLNYLRTKYGELYGL